MADAGAGPAFEPRVVPLPDGGSLVVRPIRPDDVEGLTRLYEGLDVEDRYRRFFSGSPPGARYLERTAGVIGRGGYGLVAVQERPGGHELVGEASYALLPDGDGELGMTVASGSRGWLGPYLLDALLEAAAARGVANLQADVLVSNKRMLALLAHRGFAVMDHPEWTVIRVVIGARTPMPTWPGAHDRPRVLVEGPSRTWSGEAEARAAGIQVLVCPGPTGTPSRCPALSGEPCPLASAADAIVIARASDEAPWPDLERAHGRLHPGVPVCIEPVPTAADGSDAGSGADPHPRRPGHRAIALIQSVGGRGRTTVSIGPEPHVSGRDEDERTQEVR